MSFVQISATDSMPQFYLKSWINVSCESRVILAAVILIPLSMALLGAQLALPVLSVLPVVSFVSTGLMGVAPSLFTLKATLITAVSFLGISILTGRFIGTVAGQNIPDSLDAGVVSRMYMEERGLVKPQLYYSDISLPQTYEPLFLRHLLGQFMTSEEAFKERMSNPTQKAELIQALEGCAKKLSSVAGIEDLIAELKNGKKPFGELQGQMLDLSAAVREGMKGYAMALYEPDRLQMEAYFDELVGKLKALFPGKEIREEQLKEDVDAIREALGLDCAPHSEEGRQRELCRAVLEMQDWCTDVFTERETQNPAKREWATNLSQYEKWANLHLLIDPLAEAPLIAGAPLTDLDGPRKEVKIEPLPFFFLEALAGFKRP